MASLTLKNLPDDLLDRLRERADDERRSINQQAIYILERALEDPRLAQARAQAEHWSRIGGLDGSEGWRSDRPVAEEIADLYEARTPGRPVNLEPVDL